MIPPPVYSGHGARCGVLHQHRHSKDCAQVHWASNYIMGYIELGLKAAPAVVETADRQTLHISDLLYIIHTEYIDWSS